MYHWAFGRGSSLWIALVLLLLLQILIGRLTRATCYTESNRNSHRLPLLTTRAIDPAV